MKGPHLPPRLMIETVMLVRVVVVIVAVLVEALMALVSAALPLLCG